VVRRHRSGAISPSSVSSCGGGFIGGALGLGAEREAMGQVRGEWGRTRPRGLPPMAIPCDYGVRVWALRFSIATLRKELGFHLSTFLYYG